MAKALEGKVPELTDWELTSFRVRSQCTRGCTNTALNPLGVDLFSSNSH